MPSGIYERGIKDYGVKKCLICEKEFKKRPKQKPYIFKKQKCCSRICNAKLSASYCRGKKAHNNKQTERICQWCGKIQKVAPAYSKRPFCGRKCMAKWISAKQKGQNHWNWQGGITEKYNRNTLYPGYNEWRKKVYQRDKYRCVLCKSKKSGTLNAHHLKKVRDYKDLILDVSNGLTVCEKCHKEIHYGKQKIFNTL